MKIPAAVISSVDDQSLLFALAAQSFGVSLSIALIIHLPNMDVAHCAVAQFVDQFTALFPPTLVQELILISCADRFHGDIESGILCLIKNAQKDRLASAMIQERTEVHPRIDRYTVDLLND